MLGHRLLALVALPTVGGVALATLSAPAAVSTAPDDDGERISRLADANGLSVPEMRDLLRDPAVRVTDSGRAYYVDPGATAVSGPAEAVAAAPLGRTFKLHSNPRSKRTIFLDFNGATVKGTAWNRQAGVRNGRHSGWDPANNGRKFSKLEKRVVQSIWARVAEDYAPFNVDVTTQEPKQARIHRTNKRDKVFGTRVLISESGNAHSGICGRQCGGVSFLNVFSAKGKAHSRHQPAWVFPAGLSQDLKAVAEAATHEAGHTFGLRHDGLGLDDYYTGHSLWAPIMGAGYERPVTQWSRGAYSGATTKQNDLKIIARRGAPFRRDEAGSKPKSAARLPGGTAYISKSSDVDVFRLGRCKGRIKIRAMVAKTSPNLDVRLTLLRNGKVVKSVDPPSAQQSRDKASGMNATLSRKVKAGTYFAAVDGVGRGAPSSSYNDYGSLGAYKIAVRGC